MYLKKLMEEDGYNVGLCGFSALQQDTRPFLRTLLSDVIIGGIPFVKDNKIFAPHGYNLEKSVLLKALRPSQILIGGGFEDIELPCKFLDLAKDDTFLQKNAIPTAEGIIKLAISDTDTILTDSNIMIIGNGRIGSICANMFVGLGAFVNIVIESPSNLAFCGGYNRRFIKYGEINKFLPQMDIIVSTPPGEILTKYHLNHIKKDALIIDISSTPHGVSEQVADIIKTIRPRALPGKVAPKSGARFMKDAIYNYLEGR